MKRRVGTIINFLLFGSIINVVVAVVCALWAQGSGQGGMTGTGITGAPEDMQQWYVANKPWEIADSFAGVMEETNPNYISMGWKQKRLWEPSMDVPQGNMPIGFWKRPKLASAFQTYSGWPMYSLYGEQWTRYIDGGEQSEIIYLSAWAISVEKGMVARDSARIIPLRPIWFGFAINTTFFWGILWLLIRGPFVLLHAIRRRRGRCLSCGYDLRRNLVNGCSECGWRRAGNSENIDT